MSEKVDPDQYIKSFFLLGKAKGLTLDDKFHRSGDFISTLTKLIDQALSAYSHPLPERYKIVARSIFEEAKGENGFVARSDPLAGTYYKFSGRNFEQYRQKFAANNPIAKSAAAIGSQFWTDVFEALRDDSEREVGDVFPPTISQDIPASDRLVSLKHNSDDYGAIAKGLEEYRLAVSAVNADSRNGVKRQNVLSALRAAEAYWEAAELTVVQIKVGVILALESAAQFLGKTLKSVSGELLGDLVKGIVKKSIGIDLDSL